MNARFGEFAGYRLAVDCGNAECGGERISHIAELARLHGERTLMGRVVIQRRCRSRAGAPVACAIETGPELASRGWMRRLGLIGPESREDGR